MPVYAPIRSKRNEVWKPLRDFPGYHVSNYGRVKSYRDRGGNIGSTAHLLNFQKMSDGSPRVTLSINGIGRTLSVAKLVLENFVEPGPHAFVPHYIDGDFENLHVTNLEWRSRKNVKLLPDQIKAIREITLTPITDIDITMLSKRYQVSKQTIRAIIKNEAWKQL